MTNWFLVCTTAALVAASLPHARAAQTWFLMARYGECTPVATLVRKFPDLGAIADPEAFVQLVRAKGLQVTMSSMSFPAGAAREVRVPEKDLSLVFATAELCAKPAFR